MTTVLLAGGGTGGHVFPMVAVGDAIGRVDPRARVVYVGTSRGIEGRVVGAFGGEIVFMDVAPLRGGGVRGFVHGVTRAAGSIPDARSIVKRLRPDVVMSVGGYAGGPIALGARTMGVPVAILEPNSVLGLSNRLLTPVAERAYVAFPEVERYFRPSILRRFGVPLRKAFAPVPYVVGDGPLSLLVLGGSQGAQAINETVPEAIAAAQRAGVALRVTHQTGADRDAAVRALYGRLGVADIVTVVPFIDDVAVALGSADVVIGRSGASSLAEICAVGRPSILIPYPFATDDHQMTNARSLEKARAAIAMPQREATPGRIAVELRRLALDPASRSRMASAAAALGRPDAAARVAEDLLALARVRARVKEAS